MRIIVYNSTAHIYRMATYIQMWVSHNNYIYAPDYFLLTLFYTDCSVGNADPIDDNDMPSTELGIFILPDPVPCNGTLEAWEGCAFFSNLEVSPDIFTMFATVFRPMDNSYERIDFLRINRMQASSDVICFTESDKIKVQVGDRIAATVWPNCRNSNMQRACPLNPIVVDSGSSDTVSYLTFTSASNIPQSSFTATTGVRIHLSAHISAGLIRISCYPLSLRLHSTTIDLSKFIQFILQPHPTCLLLPHQLILQFQHIQVSSISCMYVYSTVPKI